MKSLYIKITITLIGVASFQLSKAQDSDLKKMMNSSFVSVGIASLDRLVQDENQLACSSLKNGQLNIDSKLQSRIEKNNLKSIVYPSDGNYFGKWSEGEKIAQSGKGATWSDKNEDVNGGSCYNCHQLDKKEIAYGNIGPSLYNYGKLRGNSEAVVKYTWAKLYNAKAFNACSAMPRFGHFKLLTENQIRDLMALLLDPQSPVNQ
jgi:L-cysteine S-thiosulfotransferase